MKLLDEAAVIQVVDRVQQKYHQFDVLCSKVSLPRQQFELFDDLGQHSLGHPPSSELVVDVVVPLLQLAQGHLILPIFLIDMSLQPLLLNSETVLMRLLLVGLKRRGIDL